MILGHRHLCTTNSLAALWRDGAAMNHSELSGDNLTPRASVSTNAGLILVGRARGTGCYPPSSNRGELKRYMEATGGLCWTSTLHAEELSRLVSLAEDGCRNLSRTVDREAIMTVPAYFS